MEVVNYKGSIRETGYVVIPSVFNHDEVHQWRELTAAALANADGRSMKSRGGIVYAARNIFDFFAESKTLWQKPVLQRVLESVLGHDFGLVRGLYFDKPPERSWSLPWHKDMTIAVKDNSIPSEQFTNPTRKAGIDHVEAPTSVLTQMLTLRIHLDDVTEHNGALQVIPGSHKTNDMKNDPGNPPKSIYLDAGDVLAMRPLITHCSGNSTIGTSLHRRIIHLEFAANQILPDQFQWQHYFTEHAPAKT